MPVIKLPFGLTIHYGAPTNPPMVMRMHTNASRDSNMAEGIWRNHYTEHCVRKFAGLSRNANWFIGAMRFGETGERSEIGPIPKDAYPKWRSKAEWARIAVDDARIEAEDAAYEASRARQEADALEERSNG